MRETKVVKCQSENCKILEESGIYQMEDCGDNFPDGLHTGSIKIESAEGGRNVFVISSVTDRIHFGHASWA